MGMKAEICCLTSVTDGEPYSIFAKVLSLGWYDGTTSGLAQCANCGSVFKYDLLDWDADQEQRIFVLSRIERPEFDIVVSTLSAIDEPTWPFWSPRWRIDPPELRERIREQVDAHLSSANGAEYLIAANRLLSKVFSARRLSESLRRKLPKEFDGLPVTDDFKAWTDYLNAENDVGGVFVRTGVNFV
jgi:hypothetical protein